MTTMTSGFGYIGSMAFMIVGTCIGVGILGLPVQTGASGFWLAIAGLLLCWLLMASTGAIMIYRLIKHDGPITDMADVYQRDLGSWAKVVNSIGYLVTFYGLIVAHLCGAAAVVLAIFPDLKMIPWSVQVIEVLYFVVATLIVFGGMKLVSKFNAVFAVMLFVLFFAMVFDIIPHVRLENLDYFDGSKFLLQLPILLCALGFQPVLPSICAYSKEIGAGKRGIATVYIIGTVVILIINLVWLFAVLGTVPFTASSGPSLLTAGKLGLPATVPLSEAIGSNTLTFLALFFSFFVVTTSYFGLGLGFLNYMRDLTAQYFRRNRMTDFLVTFLLPLIVSLIYPNAFLVVLDLVGGVGVVLIFGFLPAFLALKKDNPLFVRLVGVFALLVSILIFSVELMRHLVV